MTNLVEKFACFLCLSLLVISGCSGSGNSVPGKIEISLEEMPQKIAGTWRQDSAELEVELHDLAEFQGFLSNEQSKATFEQSVKSAKRTYVFEVDGNYTKKETPLGRGGNLDDEIEETGQWRVTPKPDSDELWLQLSKDNFGGWSNHVVHCLEGDRLLIEEIGGVEFRDCTFTRVKE